MMYEVYIEGELVKRYPTKLQAVVYLILKGYCYWGSRDGYLLDDRAKIKELEK